MTGPKRVTDKQLAANRANAQRSTGPRTPAGKAAVRYNALTHGLLAKAAIPDALEPFESHEAFDRLLTVLCDTLSPANPVEELLVQQVAVSYWRLARLYRAEGGEIARRQGGIEDELAFRDFWAKSHNSTKIGPIEQAQAEQKALQAVLSPNSADLETLRAHIVARYPHLSNTSDERIRSAAQAYLTALQEQLAKYDHHRRTVEDAACSLPPIDEALKYARYETALQNQLDRALSRLERLQRSRAGEAVPPPLHVDVTGLELAQDQD